MCTYNNTNILYIYHNDDPNEEVGEDEVAQEEEGNDEELTALESARGQLPLQVSPAVRLHAAHSRGTVVIL